MILTIYVTVRRHVMLGKNRGKKFPLRRKPTRKATLTAKAPPKEVNSLTDCNESLIRVPRQIGSDLSSMAWADSVDVSTMATIMDCKSRPSLLFHAYNTYNKCNTYEEGYIK